MYPLAITVSPYSRSCHEQSTGQDMQAFSWYTKTRDYVMLTLWTIWH